MEGEKFFIECIEHQRPGELHRVWWLPESRGYTTDLLRAGLYSRDEAEKIVAGLRSRDERAWPESEVLSGKAGAVQICVVSGGKYD